MELWKDMFGYEKLYSISSFGRIKTKERIIVYDKNLGRGLEEKKIKEKIRKLKLNKNNGYYMIELNINGLQKTATVHSLVAKTFIHNYDKKFVVNHKDGNKLNNKLENLEIVTHKENLLHAMKSGRKHSNHFCKYKGVQYYSKAELRRVNNISERRLNKLIEFGEIEIL